MRTEVSNQMKHAVLVLLLALAAPSAFAHCDWVKGPVVLSAIDALEKGDVTPVLKWVPAKAEGEIRDAFTRTLAVRKGGDAAKALADQWFFETVVRIHRAHEGEPYTGLKDASYAPEKGIQLADAAVERGSAADLVKLLDASLQEGVSSRFAAMQKAKEHASHTPAAGREWVAAYVEFVHYVERIHSSLGRAAAHQHEH
jgi:hypothetical protein